MKNSPFGVGHCGWPTPTRALNTFLPALTSVILSLVSILHPAVDRLQFAERVLRHPARGAVGPDGSRTFSHTRPGVGRAGEDEHEVVRALRLERELADRLRADVLGFARGIGAVSRTRSTTLAQLLQVLDGRRRATAPPRSVRSRRRRVPELSFSTSAGDPRLRLRDDAACRLGRRGARRRSTPRLRSSRARLRRRDLEGGDAVLVGLRRDRLLPPGSVILTVDAGVDVADRTRIVFSWPARTVRPLLDAAPSCTAPG